MTKIEELILEIEGKICYAESTGNMKSKAELVDAKNILTTIQSAREKEHLCISCNRGDLGCCGHKPTTVICKKVVECIMYRESSDAQV